MSKIISPLNLTGFQVGKYDVLSVSEKEVLYKHLWDFIDLMDESCINELMSGKESDIDNIYKIILEESYNVLSLKKSTPIISLETVPYLKIGYEEYLRKANLNYFVQSVLPHFELNWHNIEWFNMVQLYRLLCIMAARDHSKSYSFSFAYVLWRLYRYTAPSSLIVPPDDIKYYKEGMLITNEFKLAKKLLRKVKQEIESNDILKAALYPEKNNGGWANESLVCKNASEITLSSFRTSNRGPHPGWIVVDDFLDKSAIYSKEQREKFIEVFNAEIMNMILPQGQVLTVGTPFHEKDLYSNLKESRRWRVFEYPAIFPDGSLLWENRYNFSALTDKRVTLGSMIFSREILVRPISDSVSIFPWNILEKSFIGMEKYSLVENVMSYPIKFKKVAAGVDLALSANVGADYTVIIVVGLDDLNRIHLIHCSRLHGASYNQQIATLQRINHCFSPSVILMETNGFQKIMSQLGKEVGINNIVEHVTTGNNKKDAYEGLPSLSVLFEREEIKFPRGDEKSREITNLIAGELNSVAFDDDRGKLESVGEHDDTAMALFFAIKGLKYVGNNIFLTMI